jgi:hypothetical protein
LLFLVTTISIAVTDYQPMHRKIILAYLLILSSLVGFSQQAYRIKADIFTKTRLVDSTFQISKGTLFYDKNIKKIIFDFSFPQKEKVVLFDTIMYSFRADTLYAKSLNLLIPDQSLFHFILMGNMANFGLDQAHFEMKGVEKKGDMVITTWLPPEFLRQTISKVLMATKNKLLYSVTMLDSKGTVVSRQILKNYKLIQGIDIPTEILIATYLANNQGNIYQIITMNNVILNETKNNEKYNYKL